MIQIDANAKIVVGVKQSSRAITEGQAKLILVAADAQQHVTRRIIELAELSDIPIEYVSTMKQLGKLCKIDVGAATAVIIK